MKELPKSKGSYILVNRLHSEVQLNVGALGAIKFLPGLYLYCGSARGPGGLSARINHHLRPSPRPTWHFDYLKPCTVIEETWFLESSEPYECHLVKFFAELKDASPPVRSFGSQDCYSHCNSHLVRLPLDIKIEVVFQQLKERYAGLMRTKPYGPF